MLEMEGHWWFAGEEQRWAGRLNADENKIELTLNHGPVTEHIWDQRRTKHGDILGEAANGKLVSLLACHETGAWQGQNMHKVSKFQCTGGMFVGVHHSALEPQGFSAIYVSFDLGNSWVGRRAYETGRDDEEAASGAFIVYFDPVSYLHQQETCDGALKIFFRNNPDFLSCDFSMKSTMVLSVTDEKPANYLAWKNIIEHYRWLLSLMHGCTVRVDSVVLAKKKDIHSRSVAVYPPFPTMEPKRREPRPAFSFKDICNDFTTIITQWRGKSEKYKHVCDLLLSEGSYDKMPVRFSFLLHWQVLEGIYRADIYDKNKGRYLEDFTPIKNSMMGVICGVDNPEFVEVARSRINNLNELSARALLKRFCLAFHPATIEAIGIDEDAIKRISDSRHGMTHSGSKNSISSPDQQFEDLYRLRFLEFVYLLREAGLNERDCIYQLGGTDEFRWIVDFDIFNSPKHSWAPEDCGHCVTGSYLRSQLQLLQP